MFAPFARRVPASNLGCGSRGPSALWTENAEKMMPAEICMYVFRDSNFNLDWHSKLELESNFESDRVDINCDSILFYINSYVLRT